MATSQPKQSAVPEGIHIPQGYQEQSGNLVGFWNGEGAIHFVPRALRISDSKIDPKKPSTLLIGELVEPSREIINTDKEPVKTAKGDLVGVWTKAGMSALKNLGNVPVFMYEDGEKDTGKPNPMALFKIHSPKKGTKIPVEVDSRKISRPSTTQVQQAADSDDIPF